MSSSEAEADRTQAALRDRVRSLLHQRERENSSTMSLFRAPDISQVELDRLMNQRQLNNSAMSASQTAAGRPGGELNRWGQDARGPNSSEPFGFEGPADGTYDYRQDDKISTSWGQISRRSDGPTDRNPVSPHRPRSASRRQAHASNIIRRPSASHRTPSIPNHSESQPSISSTNQTMEDFPAFMERQRRSYITQRASNGEDARAMRAAELRFRQRAEERAVERLREYEALQRREAESGLDHQRLQQRRDALASMGNIPPLIPGEAVQQRRDALAQIGDLHLASGRADDEQFQTTEPWQRYTPFGSELREEPQREPQREQPSPRFQSESQNDERYLSIWPESYSGERTQHLERRPEPSISHRRAHNDLHIDTFGLNHPVFMDRPEYSNPQGQTGAEQLARVAVEAVLIERQVRELHMEGFWDFHSQARNETGNVLLPHQREEFERRQRQTYEDIRNQASNRPNDIDLQHQREEMNRMREEYVRETIRRREGRQGPGRIGSVHNSPVECTACMETKPRAVTARVGCGHLYCSECFSGRLKMDASYHSC